MARVFLALSVAFAQGADERGQAPPRLEPYQLYSNFDISHLIRPDMSWYELLDIRQQLRRPSLAFYMDKVQYKNRMKEIGIDIPEIFYVQNADPCMDDDTFEGILQGIGQALGGRRDYVAKPTHMSCSDGVFVVKDGWNIYPKTPELVQSGQVATSLAKALRSHSSLLGESWALHQVPPGVLVEERVSAGGEDSTAALEFKTIVIWGQVWAADVRAGTDAVQVLGRDGRGLLDKSLNPKLAHVEWWRIRALAERLGAHKDCFRVDIFVSPRELGTAQTEETAVLKYQVNEVEFFITSSLPLFDEAAKLWLEGYEAGRFVRVPNSEVSGRYATMQDPRPEEELLLFAELKRELGWDGADSSGTPRMHGSLAALGAHRNLSSVSSPMTCSPK